MMIFKMLMDHAGAQERPLVRSFLRHLLAGAAIGLLLGACGYFAILLSLQEHSIQIPALFALAMLLQAAAVGGLVGSGIFMSRITDRGDGTDREQAEADRHAARDKPLSD